jgi:hypothetical protein
MVRPIARQLYDLFDHGSVTVGERVGRRDLTPNAYRPVTAVAQRMGDLQVCRDRWAAVVARDWVMVGGCRKCMRPRKSAVDREAAALAHPGVALGNLQAKPFADIVAGPFMAALGTDEPSSVNISALAPRDRGAAGLAKHCGFKLLWPLPPERQIFRRVIHGAWARGVLGKCLTARRANVTHQRTSSREARISSTHCSEIVQIMRSRLLSAKRRHVGNGVCVRAGEYTAGNPHAMEYYRLFGSVTQNGKTLPAVSLGMFPNEASAQRAADWTAGLAGLLPVAEWQPWHDGWVARSWSSDDMSLSLAIASAETPASKAARPILFFTTALCGRGARIPSSSR